MDARYTSKVIRRRFNHFKIIQINLLRVMFLQCLKVSLRISEEFIYVFDTVIIRVAIFLNVELKLLLSAMNKPLRYNLKMSVPVVDN